MEVGDVILYMDCSFIIQFQIVISKHFHHDGEKLLYREILEMEGLFEARLDARI